MPDTDQDKLRTILELKHVLEKTENEIVDKNSKLIGLLEADSAKNDLISALKDRLKKLEQENALLTARIEERRYSEEKIGKVRAEDPLHFGRNAEILLENKERKLRFLISKIKEKDSINRKMIEMANSHDGRNDLLRKFNNTIETIERERDSLKSRLAKKDNAVSELMAKIKEKDRIIAELEEKKYNLENRPLYKEERKVGILLEKGVEKNKAIAHLTNLLKEKESELAKKDEALTIFTKQKKEKEKLIEKLNEEAETQHQMNKKMFKEMGELRGMLKIKSKNELDAVAEAEFLKKKEISLGNHIQSVENENERMKKRIIEIKDATDKQVESYEAELKKSLAMLKEEKAKYETRVKKLLRENADKEMKFRESMNKMKDLLGKQNYLISQKEKKEKEILDEIGTRFSEIFTLRNELSGISDGAEKGTGSELFRSAGLDKEELNNLVSLIKIGISHNDSIDSIKNSLISSGYDSKRIDYALEILKAEDERKKAEK